MPTTVRTAGKATGFSLVEVIFALLLVGLIYVAAINTLGVARVSQVRTHEHALGYMLAQEQMSATLALPYDQVASVGSTNVPGRTDWQYEIAVEPVDPADPAATVALDQGARRIRVVVSRGPAPIAELVSVRTRAMPAMQTRQEAIAP
ncbi:MAG: hypothetical protein WD151_01530 [Phycisphaeraceae bacterium]